MVAEGTRQNDIVLASSKIHNSYGLIKQLI